MISGFNETSFQAELRNYFTPAQPISKPDHLHGRDAKLRTIGRALNSPGKHVFVYGDRGVGKTSLAKTAFQVHAPTATHIPIVACENHSEFFQLVDAIRRQVALYVAGLPQSPCVNVLSPSPPLNTGLALPTMRNINDAIEALRASTRPEGPPMVVIIDEFDQIGSDTDKKHFADLIKQLSDQEVNLRLILCGIGRSLEELIGVHLSTDRYLAAVPLEQIPHDARWRIIQTGCDRFGVTLDRDSVIRIGQISDGFPYYVHLMGEKLLWEAFDDPNDVQALSIEHYRRAITAAIEESQTSLRQAYELATQKHGGSEDYEEVLWSVADGNILSRQMTEIYEKSYIPIMEQRDSRSPLPKETYYQRMNRLKQDNHGNVIVGNKQGWYGFKENVVRGYVRLRAEKAGVLIGVDHIRYDRAGA